MRFNASAIVPPLGPDWDHLACLGSDTEYYVGMMYGLGLQNLFQQRIRIRRKYNILTNTTLSAWTPEKPQYNPKPIGTANEHCLEK